MSTSIEEIRRLDEAVRRGQAEAEIRLALLQKLKAEEDAYLELLNRKGLDEGWRVVSKDPMHRIGAKNAEIEAVIRAKAAQYPLCNRLIMHGGFEWWLVREAWKLSDEEILSDPKYLELLRFNVARGLCPDHHLLHEAPPQEEPLAEPTLAERLAHIREGFAQPVNEERLAEITVKGDAAAAERGARIAAHREQLQREGR